ncbi:N-acetylmuramoyl-L-alanine amidase [Streptomyces sp. NPDC001927]
MKESHRHGRRLTALAVTAVLAATGGTLAAPSAVAAIPANAADTTPQQAPVRFPLNAEIVSAGTTGFLSKTNTRTPEYRWTRYADGTSTVLPAAAMVTGGSDLVVTGERANPWENRVLKVHDMATPEAEPVEVDLDKLGAAYWFAGTVGSTLIVIADQPDGDWLPHLITVEGGTLTDRPVTGMPKGECLPVETSYTARTVAFDCGLGTDEVPSKVVVDLAAATAVSEHAKAGPLSTILATAVSDTHVAWYESHSTGHSIHVGRHSSTERKQLRVTSWDGDAFQMLGGWVAVGQPRRIDAGAEIYGMAPEPPRPFVAESAETGETVALLTYVSSAVPAPDGSLMVRGGTPAAGEGLYRVALGADGKPAATMVAPTGQATTVTLLGSTVPTVVTGDQLAKGVDFSWNLSRSDAYVRVALVHVRTGKRTEWTLVREPGAGNTPRTVSLRWNGKDLYSHHSTNPAPNGEYTWELIAEPDDAIGPELRATGRFTVTRPVAPHDHDDDGTPDVFVRDWGGGLVRLATQPSDAGDSITRTGHLRVGGGWEIYDRMESVGNVAGTSVADSIARDKSGVLWLYQGTGLGEKPFLTRTRVGGGWQIYDQLAGGSDLTNDGKPDLLATDKTGVLWLYTGTGNANAPFATRKKIGGGWGIYNQLTATGDLAGAPGGDLLARDKAGVLWLYLGKGDGTFAARTRLGAGWNMFKDVIGIGDGNGDGRPDLLALRDVSGDRAYFYAGTGDWRAPFKPGKATDVLPDDVSYEAGF